MMFVGEAPGECEDEKGEPFVGPAGEVLNKMFVNVGIERQQVYIANIVMCRPPGNRTPKREEYKTCSSFLGQQIAAVKPKVIVALGATAAKTLLKTSSTIAQLRGCFHEYRPAGVRGNDPNWDGCKLKVTYHPKSRRGEWRQNGEAWNDFQMVMQELGDEGTKSKYVGAL